MVKGGFVNSPSIVMIHFHFCLWLSWKNKDFRVQLLQTNFFFPHQENTLAYIQRTSVKKNHILPVSSLTCSLDLIIHGNPNYY